MPSMGKLTWLSVVRFLFHKCLCPQTKPTIQYTVIRKFTELMSEIKLIIDNNILSRISWVYFRRLGLLYQRCLASFLISTAKKKSLIDLSDFKLQGNYQIHRLTIKTHEISKVVSSYIVQSLLALVISIILIICCNICIMMTLHILTNMLEHDQNRYYSLSFKRNI